MKMIYLMLLFSFSMNHSVSFAQGSQTGGGDAKTEIRIKEIRDNILAWISSGRARELRFSKEITYPVYLKGDPSRHILGMKSVLKPTLGNVVVTVISTIEENFKDDEMNTWVDGQPKTCKRFISKRDHLRHILCNLERFWAQSEGDQYRLIHHEYAGLAGIENTLGADSDYTFSNQITSKLRYEQVLRLPVLKAQAYSFRKHDPETLELIRLKRNEPCADLVASNPAVHEMLTAVFPKVKQEMESVINRQSLLTNNQKTVELTDLQVMDGFLNEPARHPVKQRAQVYAHLILSDGDSWYALQGVMPFGNVFIHNDPLLRLSYERVTSAEGEACIYRLYSQTKKMWVYRSAPASSSESFQSYSEIPSVLIDLTVATEKWITSLESQH